MKKVAIVGVEGSGKTVMLAGLGDLYTYPDEEGYFLSPKNFSTAAYVAEKIERMRKGEWPSATAGDEMQGLDWTLERKELGVRRPPEKICEVSFLDFAGEVYRLAFGIGTGDQSLAEQAEELKRYVQDADDLIVLINLRDVILHGIRDRRVQEAMWITNAILDAALSEQAGRKAPRAAIVLSQADSYADTIKACDGAIGVLRKHLPHVANRYDWLDVFAASAVDKTRLDDDGNAVPSADFTTKGLLPIMMWIRGGAVSDGGGRGVGGVSGGAETAERVQLWEGGPYWADRNIGAANPWDSGYYFWWGDTVGYKRVGNVWMAGDGSSSNFAFSDAHIPTCKKSIVELMREGWITADNVLTPEHDAAQVQWGGGWRMPTKQELDDLCNRCDWRWTTKNGVKGYVVCGRRGYASASIFVPAVGNGAGTSLCYAGSRGYVWSSVPTSGIYDAWNIYFRSSIHRTSNNNRLYGQPVRPVLCPQR